MKEITLKKHSNTEVLRVTIGEETYSVPLGGSMSYGELRKLQKGKNNPDIVVEFFGKYIPEEVIDSLLVEDINQLMNAWSEATKQTSGATAGE